MEQVIGRRKAPDGGGNAERTRRTDAGRESRTLEAALRIIAKECGYDIRVARCMFKAYLNGEIHRGMEGEEFVIAVRECAERLRLQARVERLKTVIHDVLYHEGQDLMMYAALRLKGVLDEPD